MKSLLQSKKPKNKREGKLKGFVRLNDRSRDMLAVLAIVNIDKVAIDKPPPANPQRPPLVPKRNFNYFPFVCERQ